MEKKLNHYDVFEVIDTFEIDKIVNCQILKKWLDISQDKLSPLETELMELVRAKLEIKWDEWNEEELKMNFISFVLFLAHIDEPKRISTFYERRLSGIVNDIEISLVVDCMFASPTKSGQPKSPYFFMQEFKRSLGDSHDPEGQMLAAMILAQDKNADGKPLFGCWIQGKIWYFTILNGTEYCVSRTFDASNPNDIHQIVFILRKLKELILNR